MNRVTTLVDIAAAGKGTIYGAEVALKSVTKFVRN